MRYDENVTNEVLLAWNNWKNNGGDGDDFLGSHYLPVLERSLSQPELSATS